MPNRKLVTLALSATALGGAILAAPAAAAGDTAVTFTLAQGALTMNHASGTATLDGSGGLSLGGATVTGSLPATTVNDARGGLLHTLTVTMKSSAFTLDENENGAVDVAETRTIPDTAVSGRGGPITASSLGTLPVNASAGVAADQPMAGNGSEIVKVASVIGSLSVTDAPSVTVAVPATASSGKYIGTVTQTAS